MAYLGKHVSGAFQYVHSCSQRCLSDAKTVCMQHRLLYTNSSHHLPHVTLVRQRRPPNVMTVCETVFAADQGSDLECRKLGTSRQHAAEGACACSQRVY